MVSSRAFVIKLLSQIFRKTSMKNLLSILLFFTILASSNAQSLGFSGGVLRNNFFNLSPGVNHDFFEFSPAYGNTFAVSLDYIKVLNIPMRIGFHLENYSGSLRIQDYEPNGLFEIEASVEKQSIGIVLFPINFEIFNYLNLNFGIQASYLVKSKTTGRRISWNTTNGTQFTYFGVDAAEINTKFNTAFVGRVGWDLDISKEWTIVPQYKFNLGLSNDFKGIYGYNIKSMQHMLLLEIVRKL
jgi:hypothetical protein